MTRPNAHGHRRPAPVPAPAPTGCPRVPVPESWAEVTGWREGSDPLGTDSALGRTASVTRGHCRPTNPAGSGAPHRACRRRGLAGGGRRPGCAQLVAPGAGTLLPAADPARGQEGPLLGEGPPHCARRVGSAEQGSLPPGVPASGAVWTVTAPLQSPWMRVLSITIMWMGCEDGLLWGGAPPLVIDSRSH